MVVIRDTGPDGDRYYAVDAGSVQLVLEGTDTDLPLSIALGLSNFPHSRTVELGDPDVEPTPGDVVLRGREVLGVVRGTGSDRSAEAAPEMTFAKPPQPEEVVAVGAEPVETQAPTARFRAFPALDSPDEVREGDRFTLVARFTAHAPSTDPAEQPVIVANAPPQLTFVVQVGGFGFSFPDGIHILEHMDLEWEDQFKDLTLTMKPSEYWRRQCHATYQSDPIGVRLLDILGEDNIMWGSDFPHPDGVWPDSKAFIERELGQLPAATRRKLICENAAKLYGFSV